MLLINLPRMALNGLFCADVPLRNYSLTHSLTLDYDQVLD